MSSQRVDLFETDRAVLHISNAQKVLLSKWIMRDGNRVRTSEIDVQVNTVFVGVRRPVQKKLLNQISQHLVPKHLQAIGEESWYRKIQLTVNLR